MLHAPIFTYSEKEQELALSPIVAFAANVDLLYSVRYSNWVYLSETGAQLAVDQLLN